MTRDELILEQRKSSEQAKFWKERDAELRAMIYGGSFANLEDGKQHTIELGKGFKLKGKRPINYKVDAAKIDDALDALTKIGNSGAFLADRVIKWKPELSLTEYNQLTEEQRKAIDVAITTTPGLPVIELVEPKGES